MPPEATPHGDPRAHLARQWLEKARRDLIVAERAAQPEPLPDAVTFHCQQGAEKALKAYLAWRDQPFRRTHEIVELAQQCASLDERFAMLMPAVRALAPYAIAPRYPGEPRSDPTISEMDEARRCATTIFDFVIDRVPAEAKP
jgi:HEPN domain-containing protein